jgi:hypothetical protein
MASKAAFAWPRVGIMNTYMEWPYVEPWPRPWFWGGPEAEYDFSASLLADSLLQLFVFYHFLYLLMHRTPYSAMYISRGQATSQLLEMLLANGPQHGISPLQPEQDRPASPLRYPLLHFPPSHHLVCALYAPTSQDAFAKGPARTVGRGATKYLKVVGSEHLSGGGRRGEVDPTAPRQRVLRRHEGSLGS